MGPRHSSQSSQPSPSPAPAPPPPPSPTFKTPWRQMSWGNNERDLQYVKAYQPQHDDVTHIRVLLHGPVGAGKSSFVNSVSNVLRGRMTNSALVNADKSDKSFTKMYKTHKIKREGRGNHYPFVFNDIMGLEYDSGRGVSVEDIKLAMMGHVKDGYKFNPVSPLCPGDPGYNPSPSGDDRVHVLVCVYSANAVDRGDASLLQKMRDIREIASTLGIPQVAIITKIDEYCAVTEEDLDSVYRSKIVKKKMEDFSADLGIPMNCIFPVKNYSNEISISKDVDALILTALRLIIDFGDDFTDNM